MSTYCLLLVGSEQRKIYCVLEKFYLSEWVGKKQQIKLILYSFIFFIKEIKQIVSIISMILNRQNIIQYILCITVEKN